MDHWKRSRPVNLENNNENGNVPIARIQFVRDKKLMDLFEEDFKYVFREPSGKNKVEIRAINKEKKCYFQWDDGKSYEFTFLTLHDKKTPLRAQSRKTSPGHNQAEEEEILVRTEERKVKRLRCRDSSPNSSAAEEIIDLNQIVQAVSTDDLNKTSALPTDVEKFQEIIALVTSPILERLKSVENNQVEMLAMLKALKDSLEQRKTLSCKNRFYKPRPRLDNTGEHQDDLGNGSIENTTDQSNSCGQPEGQADLTDNTTSFVGDETWGITCLTASLEKIKTSAKEPGAFSLRLVDLLFAETVLANSNVYGKNERSPLDTNKLCAVRDCVQDFFQVPEEEMDALWHMIETKISGKCRDTRRKLRRLSGGGPIAPSDGSPTP